MTKVKFEIDLSDFCITKCPFKQSTSIGNIINVGSVECKWCDYFINISGQDKVVLCRKD